MASWYRVCFSCDYSGIKDRKGQHGFELVINEEIFTKSDKDGIVIECTSARLRKAQIPIK